MVVQRKNRYYIIRTLANQGVGRKGKKNEGRGLKVCIHRDDQKHMMEWRSWGLFSLSQSWDAFKKIQGNDRKAKSDGWLNSAKKRKKDAKKFTGAPALEKYARLRDIGRELEDKRV